MTNVKDLTGQRFGMLQVIQFGGLTHDKKATWICRCDCGNIKKFRAAAISVSKHRHSCGCSLNKTHGFSRGNRIYHVWAGIKGRCGSDHKDYGGRGIIVCERWINSFENFLEDMGQPPTAKHSIDRIDVNGNYEPSNCRWATDKEQARNTRRNHYITFNGQTKTLMEWSEVTGISRMTLQLRLTRRKWSIERALTTPNLRSHFKRKPK